MTMPTQFEIVDGKAEPVFPCRCGETHRGQYAMETWNQHNCFHHDLLWFVEGEDEAMCGQCGMLFPFSIRKPR